jgi:hypothetical protein
MYHKVVGRSDHKATSRCVGVARRAFAGNITASTSQSARRNLPDERCVPWHDQQTLRLFHVRVRTVALRTDFSEGTLRNAPSALGPAS